MLKAITVTLALAMPISAANAGTLSTFNGATNSSSDPLQVVKIASKDRSEYFSGRERLKRLLRPHFKHQGFISSKVRAATGDPNIAVFDRRTGDGPFQCGYLTYKGKRALQCN